MVLFFFIFLRFYYFYHKNILIFLNLFISYFMSITLLADW